MSMSPWHLFPMNPRWWRETRTWNRKIRRTLLPQSRHHETRLSPSFRRTLNYPSKHHSRRDWIGLYRVGANQSSLVTRTSSLGMWVPVHDEEWDGDVPIGEESQTSAPADAGASDEECGTAVFKGDSLPWTVGHYEMRYHHDGKYNVLALEWPIEIYGASSPYRVSEYQIDIDRYRSGPPRKSRLSPSSSLNCCYGRIIDIEMCIYANKLGCT